jgi:hypothetical protein
MAGRLQLVEVIVSGVLLFVVLEMVRRRRLMERYALLWLLSAIVLIVLALWRNGLVHVSRAFGIVYAPNALFFVAFAFVLVLLLHFSSAVSRLSDQTKILAQRVAMLEEQQRVDRARLPPSSLEIRGLDQADELGHGRPVARSERSSGIVG